MCETQLMYMEEIDLFEVVFKSGEHKFLETQEVLDIGFDQLAIKFAMCCPDMYVTIEQ